MVCVARWRRNKEIERAGKRERKRKKEGKKQKKRRKRNNVQHIIEKQFIGNTTEWGGGAIKCVFNSPTICSHFVLYRLFAEYPVIFATFEWIFFFCSIEVRVRLKCKRFLMWKRWVTMFRILSSFGFLMRFGWLIGCWQTVVTSTGWFCDHFYRHSTFVLFSLPAACDVSSIVPTAPIRPLSLCDARESRDYPINTRSLVRAINLKIFIRNTFN